MLYRSSGKAPQAAVVHVGFLFCFLLIYVLMCDVHAIHNEYHQSPQEHLQQENIMRSESSRFGLI